MRAALAASRRKRSRTTGSTSSGATPASATTFTATSRPSVRSIPRNTTLIPPRATGSSTS